MFSAYSKYHLKFQNQRELLHFGTAGFYAIMVTVQQEAVFAGGGQKWGSSSHWKKGL